jgi:hypothetical protein
MVLGGRAWVDQHARPAALAAGAIAWSAHFITWSLEKTIMYIDRKRVLDVDRYLAGLPANASFRVVVALGEDADIILARTGFGASPASGDTVLPRAAGPVSRFNAVGRQRVRRDLPKENRYVRTVYWRWRQWAGRYRYEDHEDFRDQYRDCYPREQVAPPSIELTYVEQDGQRWIVSPVLAQRKADREQNKHVVNLFLELFGECELVGVDLARITVPKIKKANWRLLPPGEYPWERLKTHIDRAIARTGDDAQKVIWDRQETLRSFGPDEIYVGQGGFNDYLSYVFRAHGVVVLESVRMDNAIYVFGLDWQEVSQLTKAEVLSNRFHKDRIIHAKGWKGRLARLLPQPAAA